MQNFAQFEEHVERTINVSGKPRPRAEAIAVFGLGLTGEAGEVADLLKKVIGHGHAVEHKKLIAELGDVLWYVAALANTFGLSLSEIADANEAKLRARYPDGFSYEASRRRA